MTNDKLTIILGFGLVAVALSLVYILKNNSNSKSLSLNNISTANNQLNNIVSKYKNNEVWDIVRDEYGNLIRIKVIRDAKLNK